MDRERCLWPSVAVAVLWLIYLCHKLLKGEVYGVSDVPFTFLLIQYLTNFASIQINLFVCLPTFHNMAFKPNVFVLQIHNRTQTGFILLFTAFFFT